MGIVRVRQKLDTLLRKITTQNKHKEYITDIKGKEKI